MDLEAAKTKRDARIKAKRERIKNELGATSPLPTEAPEGVTEEVKTDTAGEPAKVKKTRSKKPEKKPE